MNIFYKILILTGFIYLLGCNQNFFVPNNNTNTGETSTYEKGRIALTINNEKPGVLTSFSPIGMRKYNTRTIFPDLSADDIDFYRILGSGAGSFDLTIDAATSWISPDLATGNWLITITGLNNLFQIIADGTKDVTVEANTITPAMVNVEFLQSGVNGSLVIDVSWDASITVEGTKSDVTVNGGSPTINFFNIIDNELSYSANLPSGYYDVVIRLKNAADALLAVLVETVYVYDNLTTYWKKTLPASDINSPPAAPTGLSIREGSGKLILSWTDKSDVETAYRVYRSSDGATYSEITVSPYLPANTIGYEDGPASIGNIYYRVTAHNTFGESVPCDATYDLIEPTVLEILYPVDGATNVDVTTDMKMKFNKSMDTSVIGQVIVRDGTTDVTLDQTNCYFSFYSTELTNDSLTITFKSQAPYGKTVENLRVKNFKDLYGTPTDYTNADYNFTFKAAPPKFAESYPRINNITENSFCIDVKTDKTGKVYYKVQSDVLPPPTAQDIIGGYTGFFNITANVLARHVATTGVFQNQNFAVYIIFEEPPSNRSSIVKFNFKTPATNDVLFREDFEDESADFTPASGYFIPSGNKDSTWDNDVFKDTFITVNAYINQSEIGIIYKNPTKKFLIRNSAVPAYPSLLGASFNEATKRYVVIEYDYYITGSVGTNPVNELVVSDGTDDLNGSGSNNIAVYLKNINTPPAEVYYTSVEDNNILAAPYGTDNAFAPSLSWSANAWYKIQVVLDQDSNTFYIKLLNKDTMSISATAYGNYNNTASGNIKKVWFGCSEMNELYIDNILIYQTEVDPGSSAPIIVINKKDSGTVRSNPEIDVDFFSTSTSTLTSIEYKIGETGVYKPLTLDGSVLAVPGGTSFTANVKIHNTDFNPLLQGSSKVYFRAVDSSDNMVESLEYFTIFKDTEAPRIKNATIAPDNSYIRLEFSEKVWGDDIMNEPIGTEDLSLSLIIPGTIGTVTISGLYMNPELAQVLMPGYGYDTIYAKITPASEPSGIETCTITGIAGVIFDKIGNSVLPPGTTSAIMTFNDKKPPIVISKYPEGSVKAGLDSDLRFIFDETITPVDGKYVYIKKFSDNSTYRSFLATDASKVVVNNSEVKLIAEGYFEPDTQYYVTMDAGAFKDANGNYCEGIIDQWSWNFSTAGLYTEMIKVDGVTDGSYTQTDGTSNFIHNISTFYIGKYEVTYDLWYSVLLWDDSVNGNQYFFANAGQPGSSVTGSVYEPVTNINWRDAMVWCNAYSEKNGLTPCYHDNPAFGSPIKNSKDVNAFICDAPYVDWNANGYRLPTEGEWQFAASYKDGMSDTTFDCASGAKDSTESASAVVGWYLGNSTTTHTVGSKQANQLGIYDMSGNVYEWIWDFNQPYPSGTQTNYRGSDTVSQRVARGGSYSSAYGSLAVGSRYSANSSVADTNRGLRLARSTESAYWGSFIWRAALWGAQD